MTMLPGLRRPIRLVVYLDQETFDRLQACAEAGGVSLSCTAWSAIHEGLFLVEGEAGVEYVEGCENES